MKTFVSHLMAFALFFSLLACAKQSVMVDRVVVKNATTGKITDVKIRHEPTNRFGSVNAILPGKTLRIGLSSRGKPMLAEKAVVNWRDGEGTQWNAALDLPDDQSIAKNQRLVGLIYIIYPSGQAAVYLRESQSGD